MWPNVSLLQSSFYRRQGVNACGVPFDTRTSKSSFNQKKDSYYIPFNEFIFFSSPPSPFPSNDILNLQHPTTNLILLVVLRFLGEHAKPRKKNSIHQQTSFPVQTSCIRLTKWGSHDHLNESKLC